MQMVCILQDKLHSIPTIALRLVLLFYIYSFNAQVMDHTS